MASVDIFGFDVPSKIFGWYTDACGSVDRRLDTRNNWITIAFGLREKEHGIYVWRQRGSSMVERC